MSRRLYILLVLGVCIGSLLLFAVMHKTDEMLSRQLTRIAPEHQAQLNAYAREAETLYHRNDIAGLQALMARIGETHRTWAAVLAQDLTATKGTQVPEAYQRQLRFQRKVDWPVHAGWNEVLIGIPFQQASSSLVIRLPDQMHPRPNLMLLHVVLTWLLPLSILLLFTHWLYRHLVRPVNILKDAAKDLAFRECAQPVRPQLGRRRDELAQLATSFDEMAERIQALVASQRQLIGDLSHELRTPLARMKLVQESGWSHARQQQKIAREIAIIDRLVDDAMTLAWLDNEERRALPEHLQETVALDQLLDVICEDAEFEFQGQQIVREYPEGLQLARSNTLALSQVLENVIRNGMSYNPSDGRLRVTVMPEPEQLVVLITDQGPGVPDARLETIFQPFFRLDKARARRNGGFGLGLAIARKQLTRLGGDIQAHNAAGAGLCVQIRLPYSGNAV